MKSAGVGFFGKLRFFGLVLIGFMWCPASEISNLYQQDNVTGTLRQEQPTTMYMFFQAQESLQLTGISVYGEPLNYHAETSDYRWQLFKTTAAWQTPNGNDDRLFYSQVFIDDHGETDYFTPLDVMLEKGSFYRLSFQVSNVDWNQTYHEITESSAPFFTSDNRFLVYGFGHSWEVPGTRYTADYSLITSAVPEPKSILLFGFGLCLMLVFRFRGRQGKLEKGLPIQ